MHRKMQELDALKADANYSKERLRTLQIELQKCQINFALTVVNYIQHHPDTKGLSDRLYPINSPEKRNFNDFIMSILG
jgi:glucan phosphorylase